MGDDDRTMELTLLHHLEGGQSLAEPHLRIPEHDGAGRGELRDGLVDGELLLRTEHDRLLVLLDIPGIDGAALLLRRLNGLEGRVKGALEPLRSLTLLRETVALHAGAEKDVVDLLVVEVRELALVDGHRQLRVEKLVRDAGRLRVLVDTLAGGGVERLAVGLQRPVGRLFERGLANLQTAPVGLVIDGEDIDQRRVQ